MVNTLNVRRWIRMDKLRTIFSDTRILKSTFRALRKSKLMRGIQRKTGLPWNEFTKQIIILSMNPYIPHRPFKQQLEFLLDPIEEIFYGGSAGGGKSDALLIGALQYVLFP